MNEASMGVSRKKRVPITRIVMSWGLSRGPHFLKPSYHAWAFVLIYLHLQWAVGDPRPRTEASSKQTVDGLSHLRLSRVI